MTVEQYEKSLREYIKKTPKNNTLVQFIIIFATLFALYFLMTKIRGELFLLVFIAILLVGLSLLKITSGGKGKLKTYVYKSIDALKRNSYNESFDWLLNAYNVRKNDFLIEIMNNFACDFNISALQKAFLTKMQIKKDKKENKKDKNYLKLLDQLDQTSSYILMHNKSIEESIEKIRMLEKKLNTIDEKMMRKEYTDLIKRYNDIISLENSKMQFYSKAQNQLYDLKRKHLMNKELIMEKEKLRNFEDSILEKSIVESYDDNIDKFIFYEAEYLKALKEYSQTLSVSSDENLFDEIIRDFELKIKSIS